MSHKPSARRPAPAAGRARNADPTDRSRTLRIAIIATAALVVVVAGIGIAVSVINNSSRTVSAAIRTDAASTAPGVIDFQPTTGEPDTGRVESLPAAAAEKADYPYLLPVGMLAPDFDLATATGGQVKLSDLRGKTVLLEFFATWCPHCQAEAPHLKKIMESLPPKTFEMLQINADSEDAASMLAYDRYYGITSPGLLDPGSRPGSFYHQGATGPVTERYKIAIYPTFYIIDPRGRIAWRADHEQPDALILEKLKDATRS